MISIVLFGALLGVVLCCPSDPSTILPCKCEGSRVSCLTYNSDFDLDHVFTMLAAGRNPGEQQYEEFVLTSNTIEELGPNVFHGVWFRQITLNNNPKLACINPLAFYTMDQMTTKFTATYTNLSTLDTTPKSSCNLFAALSTLRNLETVQIAASEMTEIPTGAFHGTAGRQERLQTIDLSGGQGGSITKISGNAFAELKNIKSIDLSKHMITTIESFAFSFTEPNNNELTISLEENQGMTGNSFGSLAFDVGNRRTTLKLGGITTLKFLKEDPFRQFLANKNDGSDKIDLLGTTLDYYYQNQWLIKYEATMNLQTKITNALMVDGKKLWEVSDDRKFSVTPTEPTTVGTTGADSNATSAASDASSASTTVSTTLAL